MNKKILKFLPAIILASGFIVSSAVFAQVTSTSGAATAPTDAQLNAATGITFPVPELGNCTDRESCRAYCNDLSHMTACVDFAQAHGLANKDEAALARKYIVKVQNKETPGGCTDPRSCNQYCQSISHLNECLSFAKENGVSDDNIQEGQRVSTYLASGGKTPGGCDTKDACELYCKDFSHVSECIAFAKNSGLLKRIAAEQGLPEGQFEKLLQLTQDGQAPGGCKSKDQCEAYCKDSAHLSECVDFGVKAGFVSADKAEMIKKIGGKGPGGCNSEESCKNYCNDPAHSPECFNFAKDNGLISNEDLQRAQDGIVQLKMGLEKAPPEIKACLNSVLGPDAVAGVQNGTFVPSPEIGDRLKECAGKFKTSVNPGEMFKGAPPAVANCLKDKIGGLADKLASGAVSPDANSADAFRVCMGQARIMQGGGEGGGMPDVGSFMNGAPPEIQTCIKEKLGSDFAEKVAKGEASPSDIQGKMKDCFSNFKPQMPPGFEGGPARQGGGEGGLQGEAYHGIPPKNGICSPGWDLETNNGEKYCAPTQAQCDAEHPGSVLTTDNSGFKVCWNKTQGGEGQSGRGQGYAPAGIPGGTTGGMMNSIPPALLDCVKTKLGAEGFAKVSQNGPTNDFKEAIQSCSSSMYPGAGGQTGAPAGIPGIPNTPNIPSGYGTPPSGTMPPAGSIPPGYGAPTGYGQ